MSNGKPILPAQEGETKRSKVIYAEGMDPEKNKDDWYDTCHDICGGDDFGMALPIEMFDAIIKACESRKRSKFIVRLTQRHVKLLPAPK